MRSRILAVCLVVLLAKAKISVAQITNHCDGQNIRCLDCQKSTSGDLYDCKQCAYLQTLYSKKCSKNIDIEHCQSMLKEKCDICEYGYVQTDDFLTCNRMKDKNCIVGIKEDPGVIKCRYCKPGFAAKNDDGSCVQVEDSKKKPHCLSYQNYKGLISCIQCEKGYSLSDNLICIQTCGEGCAICTSDRKSCRECANVFGYFQTSPGKCSFKGLPNGIDPFNLSTNIIQAFLSLILGMLALTI